MEEVINTLQNNHIQVVVLAAGHGKRMKSELPKVLIPLRGKPLVHHLIEAIKTSGVCDMPVLVVGQKAEMVKESLGDNVAYVTQTEQLGTGHAVACAKELLQPLDKNVMVLYGDHPYVSAETIKTIAHAHEINNAVITMATVEVPDFDDWRQSFYDFGRVVRDEHGGVIGIVEKKDATQEELKIREVNPSYFCFKAEWLWHNLEKLGNSNAQHEYYLTDLPKLAVAQKQKIVTVSIEPKEALGVNTPEQLALVEKVA